MEADAKLRALNNRVLNSVHELIAVKNSYGVIEVSVVERLQEEFIACMSRLVDANLINEEITISSEQDAQGSRKMTALQVLLCVKRTLPVHNRLDHCFEDSKDCFEKKVDGLIVRSLKAKLENNVLDASGRNALMIAIDYDQLRIAEELLNVITDQNVINHKDSKKETAFQKIFIGAIKNYADTDYNVQNCHKHAFHGYTFDIYSLAQGLVKKGAYIGTENDRKEGHTFFDLDDLINECKCATNKKATNKKHSMHVNEDRTSFSLIESKVKEVRLYYLEAYLKKLREEGAQSDISDVKSESIASQSRRTHG